MQVLIKSNVLHEGCFYSEGDILCCDGARASELIARGLAEEVRTKTIEEPQTQIEKTSSRKKIKTK